MYITLSNIQNGECVPVNPVINNMEGNFEIALHEITYYPSWSNISSELHNNTFYYNKELITIPSGYYDICALNEQVFTPLKLRLVHNTANGLVSIMNIKSVINLGWGLGPTLGFTSPNASTNDTITGDAFPQLIVFRELFVHLDEGLSTSENRHNTFPSTLLRAVPVKKEACNSGRTETFVRPHFKHLVNGALSGIKISVRDENKQMVKLAYLSCVLEVRKRVN
jgi:hypothetical protein